MCICQESQSYLNILPFSRQLLLSWRQRWPTNNQIRARVDYNSMTLNLNSATCPRGSMISCYRILSVWGPLPPPGATPTSWNSPRLSANSQVANSQVANNNSLKSPSAPLKSFESLKPLKSPSSSTAPASPDLLAQCGRPTLLLQRRSAPCIRYKFQIFHFIWCWWLLPQIVVVWPREWNVPLFSWITR